MVVDYHDVELLLIADSFDEALLTMLTADRELRLLRSH
jgi:hypothetical protein